MIAYVVLAIVLVGLLILARRAYQAAKRDESMGPKLIVGPRYTAQVTRDVHRAEQHGT